MTASAHGAPLPATQAFLDQFDREQPRLPGAALPWLAQARATARDRFARQGLPSQRLESWKYTPLKLPVFVSPEAGPDAPAPAYVPDAYVCRFDNGALAALPPGPLPAGVTIAALATHADLAAASLKRDDDRTMAALNGALWRDGVVIRVAAGVRVDKPIVLQFTTTPGTIAAAWHPRLVIELGEQAEASVLEEHGGASGGTAPTLSNLVTDIALGRGALLHHYKSQAEPDGAWHIASGTVRVGDGATYDGFLLSCGAALARNEIQVSLDGADATCRVAGVTMLRGHRHADATLSVDHRFARGTSRQLFKSVIDDEAHSVFQGRIVVHPGATKTDGQQMSRALLLSDHAIADAKPELEIHADDVKCGHGSTVGALDDDALFYLRARGIDHDTARALLIEAFLADTLEEIVDEAVQARFLAMISAWLKERG